jgi:hypothetical protein
MKLSNPKDKKNIQKTLRQGAATEFWQIILQALDESIQYLQNQQDSEEMRELSSEQYKVENEILKAKRANLKILKELPSTIMGWLENPDQSEPEFDPYNKPEDFEK